MFASVQSSFPAFSAGFEGRVPYMYVDIKGLVTVGVGNLVDPVGLAQALPFRFKNKPGISAPGSPATPDQIAGEWRTLKNDPSLTTKKYTACEPITQLELSDESIDTLISNRLTQNESFLKRQPWFQNFDTWPADAQLALLSMTWAMGPAGPGGFPLFRAACQNLDFNTAAAECRMNEAGNAGLVPRNKANVTLFSNAAIVVAAGAQGTLQRSNLYYPRVLTAADIAPAGSSPGTTD
jgi:GH24 family phage-related lysozyme (muramidase)